MNCTIYLFGSFDQGITLYPNDYTKNIFKEFLSRASAPTQLIIHREETIMNYGYIRKIENDHQFGICVQINGQYITGINKIFEIFEDITTNIIVRGDILQLNNEGNIVSPISAFTNKPQEVNRVISYCQTELLKLSSFCQTLPNIDYSTSNSDFKNFKDSDNEQDIINSSVKNGYTFIYKKEDYDSLALSGYRSTLYYLNKENEKNKIQIIELKNELNKVKLQKKQIKLVAWLFAALIVFAIIMWNVISDKNKNIKMQVGEINSLTNINKDYSDSISIMNSNLNTIRANYNSIEHEFKEFKKFIGKKYPIIIDSITIENTDSKGNVRSEYGNIIYASNSMYLRPKVIYKGIISGTIELKVKFYTPDGKLSVATSAPNGYSYSDKVIISIGDNDLYLSGYGYSEPGSWGSGLYKYEIWYDDICLKQSTFTLY